MEHTADRVYQALMAAAIAAPVQLSKDWAPAHGRVTISTGPRASATLKNSADRLRIFAEQVRKNWAAFGGGPKPADIQRPARRPAHWPAALLKIWAEQLDQREYADVLRIGADLGAVFFQQVARPPFMLVAPQPVEGLPDEFRSARRCDGRFVVFDTLSGYAVGARGYGSRKAAEDEARAAWGRTDPTARDAAITRARAEAAAGARQQAEAREAWAAAHGLAELPQVDQLAELAAAPMVAELAELAAAPVAAAALVDQAPQQAAAPGLPRRMADALALLAAAVASSCPTRPPQAHQTPAPALLATAGRAGTPRAPAGRPGGGPIGCAPHPGRLRPVPGPTRPPQAHQAPPPALLATTGSAGPPWTPAARPGGGPIGGAPHPGRLRPVPGPTRPPQAHQAPAQALPATAGRAGPPWAPAGRPGGGPIGWAPHPGRLRPVPGPTGPPQAHQAPAPALLATAGRGGPSWAPAARPGGGPIGQAPHPGRLRPVRRAGHPCPAHPPPVAGHGPPRHVRRGLHFHPVPTPSRLIGRRQGPP